MFQVLNFNLVSFIFVFKMSRIRVYGNTMQVLFIYMSRIWIYGNQEVNARKARKQTLLQMV